MRKPFIRSAHRLSGLLSVMVCVLSCAPATAQMSMTEMASRAGITIAAGGRSGARLRQRSISQLPWEQISASSQKRIRDVLDNCAQFRRLPELVYEVRPDVYRYLVEHPDVAVSTWRVMGISKVQMWQTGPMEFEATAPDGSAGLADVLYRDQSQCLLLFDGTYNSPLLPRPITASGLVWLRYHYQPGKDGKTQVRQLMNVFVSFPSVTARAMALLASPITNVIMDRNAFEVSLYARMMSQAAENDPDWFRQLAVQMDGVLPQRHQELTSLVRSVETDRARTTAVSGRTTRDLETLQRLRLSLSKSFQTMSRPASDRTSGTSPEFQGQLGVHHMTESLLPSKETAVSLTSPDRCAEGQSLEGKTPAGTAAPTDDRTPSVLFPPDSGRL